LSEIRIRVAIVDLGILSSDTAVGDSPLKRSETDLVSSQNEYAKAMNFLHVVSNPWELIEILHGGSVVVVATGSVVVGIKIIVASALTVTLYLFL